MSALKQHHPNSIVKFRGKRGWSVKDCAAKVGCDEWSVRNLEMGHMNLHDGWIRRFSKLFNVKPSELVAPCYMPRNAGVNYKRMRKNLEKGRGKNQWAGKLRIPAHAPPLVRQLFEILNSKKLMVADIAEKSGVNKDTISGWRYNRAPTLTNYTAVINSLGYDLELTDTGFAPKERIDQ